MRLFIALPIPTFAKQQLLDLKRPIKGFRWQQENQIHLTLKFLGETDLEIIQELKTNLQSIVVPAFSITINGLGYFPRGKRPKVLWAGVNENELLAELYMEVQKACSELGFETESRSFKPHVTIARMKKVLRKDVISFVKEQQRFRIPDIAVNEFVLYESQLNAGGARHSRLKTFPLQKKSN